MGKGESQGKGFPKSMWKWAWPFRGPHPGCRVTHSPSVKGGSGAAAGVVARPTAVTVAAVPGGGVAALVATLGLGHRQPLNDAVAGQHATIHREVAAHHEGSHGSVLLRQEIRFVGEIGLILAAVDHNEARVAAVVTVTLVRRIRPPAAPAEA